MATVRPVRPSARVRAPELTGDRWLNTGGRPLRLAELRGRIVLLDFWTSGCINCLHALDELRPLEREFADVLVTIGVHSPKFRHEGEAAAIDAAVRRHDVHHPVLNDPDLTTWQQYAVKAWPTLVLVDPEGYVVHVAAGEGHADALRRVITELVAEHERRGTLRRGGSPYVATRDDSTELRFPSKAVPTAEGTLLVADTGHHRVVELAADGRTVLRAFGDGTRGDTDGLAPRFAEPSGIAVLPPEVAVRVGYSVVVADTAGHRLRGIDLATGTVTTVAGTGRQWRTGPDAGPARDVDLTSPWDVAWWQPAGGVVVAMAGNHTLGLFDPVADTVARFAGTTVEGLRDGAAGSAFFAQTSGLAATDDRLWLVDAETSALRWMRPGDGAQGGFTVHTAVGTDLFTFGHADGPADAALLQHPLGVAVLPDGSVAIADTYNGAVRRYDPATNTVNTLARDLAEPSGLVVRDGELLVVESAAHQIRPVPTGDTAVIDGQRQVVRRPPTVLAPGELDLTVVFVPPPGEKLDDRYGPATRLEVTAAPPELLVEGAGGGTELTRRLRLAGDVREGVLQVVAQAASCDVTAEHPACRVTRQDWGVPVRIEPGGAPVLELVMAGS
ncbi:Thiol-disulfide isomerase or thioredoxin [Amycolatopsis arida]|uniref:Thiol-disulfide isomerase or thioredoxin n=1 Tax=Amycolatopsis arida TaxID=587909 RepID=A0A1I5TIZ3_9PSEU|nr:NHL domain-containing thioredoxin family protein [Amycolatopsis arida]TDX96078.1 thiol-disulfide isomerase/thioredoxin [Amycolatopsis arida]SFP82995.1 Thiol-disulfide isomerase or thioredoxin [Amycolatopsis arida]